MSICRQHERRDAIGDVSELLRPLRYERAPGPKQAVTPDQYRQWQEQRAAEGVAGVKASGHVNAPHVQPPMALDAIAKKPGQWFDAAVKKIPAAIRNIPVTGHNYGGSAGLPAQSNRGTVEHHIRGGAATVSPVDLSPNATPESQIVHGALSLAPLIPRKAVVAGGKAIVGALARDARAGAKHLAERGVAGAVKDAFEALPKLRPKAKPTPPAAAAERGAWEATPQWGTQAPAKAAAAAAEAPKRSVLGTAWRAGTWPIRAPLKAAGKGIAWAVREPINASWVIPQALRAGVGLGALGWVGYEAIKRGLNGLDAHGPDLTQSPGKANPVLKPQDPKAPIDPAEFDGRKMLGPKGEVPGNDEHGNALPGKRPDVPFKAEHAPGIGALNALGNDSSMNRLRFEYAALERKVRMLQDRGLPMHAAMRPDEIDRWAELNSPEFQTPGGNSIFKGRN